MTGIGLTQNSRQARGSPQLTHQGFAERLRMAGWTLQRRSPGQGGTSTTTDLGVHNDPKQSFTMHRNRCSRSSETSRRGARATKSGVLLGAFGLIGQEGQHRARAHSPLALLRLFTTCRRELSHIERPMPSFRRTQAFVRCASHPHSSAQSKHPIQPFVPHDLTHPIVYCGVRLPSEHQPTSSLLFPQRRTR